MPVADYERPHSDNSCAFLVPSIFGDLLQMCCKCWRKNLQQHLRHLRGAPRGKSTQFKWALFIVRIAIRPPVLRNSDQISLSNVNSGNYLFKQGSRSARLSPQSMTWDECKNIWYTPTCAVVYY